MGRKGRSSFSVTSFFNKPRQHRLPDHHSARRSGPISTAAPKKSRPSYSDRFKSTVARSSSSLLGGFGGRLLGGALSGGISHLPEMLANAIPSLDTVLGQPKLLLGVGLCLFIAYEALKF